MAVEVPEGYPDSGDQVTIRLRDYYDLVAAVSEKNAVIACMSRQIEMLTQQLDDTVSNSLFAE